MLMLCSTRASTTKCLTYPDPSRLQEPNLSLSKNSHANSLSSNPLAHRPCNCTLHCSLFSWKDRFHPNTYHASHHVAPKKWLCQLGDSVPSGDEYRSSRSIAISLFRRYRNAVDRGGGDNLKFISAGVNAYALGCTDEGLRKELADMKESGVEIEAMQSFGGNTSLKSRIASEEVDECILWLSIIFITLLCTPPPTVVRWSSTPPASVEGLLYLFLLDSQVITWKRGIKPAIVHVRPLKYWSRFQKFAGATDYWSLNQFAENVTLEKKKIYIIRDTAGITTLPFVVLL